MTVGLLNMKPAEKHSVTDYISSDVNAHIVEILFLINTLSIHLVLKEYQLSPLQTFVAP